MCVFTEDIYLLLQKTVYPFTKLKRKKKFFPAAVWQRITTKIKLFKWNWKKNAKHGKTVTHTHITVTGISSHSTKPHCIFKNQTNNHNQPTAASQETVWVGGSDI